MVIIRSSLEDIELLIKGELKTNISDVIQILNARCYAFSVLYRDVWLKKSFLIFLMTDQSCIGNPIFQKIILNNYKMRFNDYEPIHQEIFTFIWRDFLFFFL